MSATGFYTYEHIRNDTGVVFYVGKGRGRRIDARYDRNIHWKRIVAKAGGFSTRFVVNSVDEELAFLVEMERIDQLRRTDVVLCNMTNGGEGSSGFFPNEETRRKLSEKRSGSLNPLFGKPRSESTKEKIRLAKIGKTLSEESKAKISAAIKGRKESLETRIKKSIALSGRVGSKLSDETKLKISKALKGKPKSKLMRNKLSKTRKGLKLLTIECPYCEKQGSVLNMRRWHFENCKSKELT
jgi:hypothetical protein